MKNLTEGNPVKLMLSFALPVCIGNIFQLFYSLADTRIVGSVLGGNSLAAVGATTAISTLLIGFLQDLQLLLPVASGQKDGKSLERRQQELCSWAGQPQRRLCCRCFWD